jgi:hypothetical protein
MQMLTPMQMERHYFSKGSMAMQVHYEYALACYLCI